MEPNPSVIVTSEPQWLHPVQLGTSTLLRLAEDPHTLDAVQALLERLAPDPYVDFMRRYYDLGRARFGTQWGYADQLTVLHAATRLVQPRRYLEIGVFRGRSISVVASQAPDCQLYGFDLWVENYAGLENAGPELVRRQLERVGFKGQASFVSGSSHDTVPAFLAQHPELTFDLVTVDGDHTEDGARRDLEVVLPRVAVGGVLVFDDIRHPQHPWLERVWDEVVGAHPAFLACKYVEVGHGVAFAIRRDPDSDELLRVRGGADQRLRILAEALESVRREADERVEASEADRALRLQIIERQGGELGQLAAERNELRQKAADLESHLARAEEDRARRLEVIERQGRELGELAAQRNELRQRLDELQTYLAHVETDRAARLAIIERQGEQLAQHASRLDRLEREQARELVRLMRQADQVDQARAIVRSSVWELLTPRKARRLAELLDEMATQLAGEPEPDGSSA